MPTVPEIITIAKISQFLAANDIRQKGLSGGGVNITLPRKLYMVRKNVEWLYDLNSSDDTLTGRANYLYALCAPYNLKAQTITGTGGSVAPIRSASAPDPIEFEVDATSFMITGQSAKTFPIEWEGFNLIFVRNELPQGTLDLGGTYYSWDRDTRELIISPAAIVGEHFFFMPAG